MSPALLFQVLLLFGFPWLASRIETRLPQISAVLQCYAIGMILGNQSLIPVHEFWSTQIRDITILLAIPLLLYATDFGAWVKQAKSVLTAFALAVVSALLGAGVWSLFLAHQFPESWKVGGMLVGVYTGGIANMNAIGIALDAPDELLINLNIADIVCGGIFLLFLVSIAQRVYGWILPEYQKKNTIADVNGNMGQKKVPFNSIWKAGLLTMLVVGASVGLTYLLTGALKNVTLLLLLISAGSIIASLFKSVRALPGTFKMGEYLLLIFCVALGTLADFRNIAQDAVLLIGFTALVLITTAGLHLLLCRLFKIDRDTTLITATAALYGPVFIGQVASALRNKELIFAGIATGLVGYGLGNFLGTGIAYFLKWFAL